jgi:Bacterial flagellin N-terminal helical region
VVLGVTGGGEARGGDAVVLDEILGELAGASRRKFPVEGELRGVDGDIVGVSLDAQVIRRGGEHIGDLIERGAGVRVTNLLNRAVTLATEASNGTLSGSQFNATDQEYQSILAEINNVESTTTYNGNTVFTGSVRSPRYFETAWAAASIASATSPACEIKTQ